ncbi:MAG TPA: 4-hydroxythreonine-4-phosphate dehydrogenase PdxA [Mariprofundaceae bacterium]|nr:4-hydroxythreonine-4-phosphate dehydrogenase PdxA [Mariprofundaceae bacterium]
MSPLLLTPGEPAGIGPDCILRAFRAEPARFDRVVIVAPKAWIEARAAMIGMHVAISEVASLKEAAFCEGLCCWTPGLEPSSYAVEAGRPRAETAHAVIRCIEAAADACLDGRAAGMVTGPIEKAVLRDVGFDFPGHTEFLAHLAGVPRVVMMLAAAPLRVALLTTHMALRAVPDALTVEDTLASIRIVNSDLQRCFGIERPRLGLCGLNPHAGEAGHFGREELDILTPAVAQAHREGVDIRGPLPADTLFSAGLRKQFDTIVCCYHDQALIPIKALSFGDAVNVTLGLPFIRTSVDHGTALDRAGGSDVSYSSLITAINLASAMRQEVERELQ